MGARLESGAERGRSGLISVAILAICVAGFATPAAAQSINLAWDASTDPNLAGYRVYAGLSSGGYSQSFDVPAGTTMFAYLNPTTGTRYYFAVTAYDNQGLESPHSNEVTGVFGGDNVLPTVAITTPAGAVTVTSSTIALVGTALDNVGVTQVTWANSRGGSGTATGTTAWSVAGVPLQSGSNVITVTARDAAGNTRSVTRTVTYNLQPPLAPVLVSPSGTSTTTRPSFTWNALSAVTRYQIWVNDSNGKGRIQTIYTPAQAGCAAGSGTCTVSPGVTLAGSVTWWAIATNSAGDGPWSAPLSFTLAGGDTTAPNVAIANPVGAVTIGTSAIGVSGTASDNVGVTQVTWTNNRGGSGTASGTTSWSIGSVALQTGINVITVTARDAANNTRQATVTVTYATLAAPAAPVLASPNGSSSTSRPSFSWSAVGNATSYQIWVNDSTGNGKIQTIYPVSLAGCNGGVGTCTVSPGVALTGTVRWWVLSGNAGGQSSWSVPLTFTVTTSTAGDATAPSVAITSPSGPATVNTSSVAVSGTAADNVGVTQVTWTTDRGSNGTASGTTAWSATIPLQLGANVITVTARDAANNTRQASVAVTWGASALPAAPVLVSPSGTSNTTRPAFTWNAVANATGYQLWVNDSTGNGKIQTVYTASQAGCSGGAGTCTVSPGVALGGNVQWWVISRNAAGQSPWSAPSTFTVLGGGLYTPVLVSPNAGITGRMPTFTWTAVPGARRYTLWVNDSQMKGRIQTLVVPADAHCASGTGQCWLTTGIALAPGTAQWFLLASDGATDTPWSAPFSFVVQ